MSGRAFKISLDPDSGGGDCINIDDDHTNVFTVMESKSTDSVVECRGLVI